MQGKILRFSLSSHALAMGKKVSPRAISALKLLWIALADFYNDETHQCNPSIATLARCIEKSESQTSAHMSTLKNLGIVSVTKNAKGGRYTPNYAINIPSQLVDASANSLADATPRSVSNTVDEVKPSYRRDSTPPVDKIRILIDPLDKTLIKELVKEKISPQKQQELTRLGNKYKIRLAANASLHELQDRLLMMANHSYS